MESRESYYKTEEQRANGYRTIFVQRANESDENSRFVVIADQNGNRQNHRDYHSERPENDHEHYAEDKKKGGRPSSFDRMRDPHADANRGLAFLAQLNVHTTLDIYGSSGDVTCTSHFSSSRALISGRVKEIQNMVAHVPFNTIFYSKKALNPNLNTKFNLQMKLPCATPDFSVSWVEKMFDRVVMKKKILTFEAYLALLYIKDCIAGLNFRLVPQLFRLQHDIMCMLFCCKYNAIVEFGKPKLANRYQDLDNASFKYWNNEISEDEVRFMLKGTVDSLRRARFDYYSRFFEYMNQFTGAEKLNLSFIFDIFDVGYDRDLSLEVTRLSIDKSLKLEKELVAYMEIRYGGKSNEGYHDGLPSGIERIIRWSLFNIPGHFIEKQRITVSTELLAFRRLTTNGNMPPFTSKVEDILHGLYSFIDIIGVKLDQLPALRAQKAKNLTEAESVEARDRVYIEEMKGRDRNIIYCIAFDTDFKGSIIVYTHQGCLYEYKGRVSAPIFSQARLTPPKGALNCKYKFALFDTFIIHKKDVNIFKEFDLMYDPDYKNKKDGKVIDELIRMYSTQIRGWNKNNRANQHEDAYGSEPSGKQEENVNKSKTGLTGVTMIGNTVLRIGIEKEKEKIENLEMSHKNLENLEKTKSDGGLQGITAKLRNKSFDPEDAEMHRRISDKMSKLKDYTPQEYDEDDEDESIEMEFKRSVAYSGYARARIDFELNRKNYDTSRFDKYDDGKEPFFRNWESTMQRHYALSAWSKKRKNNVVDNNSNNNNNNNNLEVKSNQSKNLFTHVNKGFDVRDSAKKLMDY